MKRKKPIWIFPAKIVSGREIHQGRPGLTQESLPDDPGNKTGQLEGGPAEGPAGPAEVGAGEPWLREDDTVGKRAGSSR